MTQAAPDESGPLAPLIAYGLTRELLAEYGAAFDIYHLTLEDDLSLALRHSRDGAALAFAPQNAVAAVVAAPSQAIMVAEWAAAASLDAPVVRHADGVAAMLAAVAQRVQRSARLAGEVTLRLAALRAAHENLQNAYEGLRAHVQERGLLLPALGFLAVPDRDGSALPQRVAEVTQYIPCALRTLCGIGLHLAAPIAPGGQGFLEVELTSPENAALGALWRVPYAQLQAGWNTFVFEGNGPALASSALLRLRFRTDSGAQPAFSLARPHLRPDRAAMADGERLARPLAFRAWTNLPGAPLTLTAQLWPAFQPVPAADAAPALLPRIEVLAGDDFTVEDVRKLGETLDFQPVRKLPKQRRILIHPLGRLPSIGRIPLGCPAGTVEIRAEVETDHAEAADLEYGIALAAAPVLDRTGAPTGDYSFDGPADWLVVPAKTPGTLVIELDAPLAEASDLYLICRCPPGSISDWGWAHVTRLTLRGDFRPDAFAGSPLTLEAAG